MESNSADEKAYLELCADIDELKMLKSHSKRQNIKALLDRKIQEYEALCNSEQKKEKRSRPERAAPSPHIKITDYAWDDDCKYLKLYLTLPGIQSLPPENISANFTDRSVELLVKGLPSGNHSLTIKDLAYPIDPSLSTYKQKTDILLLSLKKLDEKQAWGCITKAGLQLKEKKNEPKFDDKKDPQESIMNMMKNLYDEGDDDMKRMIRKTWYESQSKQRSSDLNDF